MIQLFFWNIKKHKSKNRKLASAKINNSENNVHCLFLFNTNKSNYYYFFNNILKTSPKFANAAKNK
jgi:hypothetical protein